jgi:hypothetical protein
MNTRLLDALLLAAPRLPLVPPLALATSWASAADERSGREHYRCALCPRISVVAFLVEPGPLTAHQHRWLDLCHFCRLAVHALMLKEWPGDDAVLARFLQLHSENPAA